MQSSGRAVWGWLIDSPIYVRWSEWFVAGRVVFNDCHVDGRKTAAHKLRKTTVATSFKGGLDSCQKIDEEVKLIQTRSVGNVTHKQESTLYDMVASRPFEPLSTMTYLLSAIVMMAFTVFF